jgi:hypothetical protein
MTALIQFFDSDGFTGITTKNLPDAFAGANQRPVKLGYISLSDRQLLNIQDLITAILNNDGFTMVQFAPDPITLSSPFGFTATLGAPAGGGVWASTGVRGYKITALSALGESGPSAEITINIDDTTKKVTLNWTQVAGATGYKIYRTDTPGTYGASSLRTTIGSGATVTFLDDGSATTTGTPPTQNTTAGWIVTPVLSAPGAGGVWPATGPQFWRVVALDSTGAEIANTLEATLTVDNTTKTVTLTWPAVAAASSFKIFRSTVSGSYPSPNLVTTLGAGSTSFVDTGTALTAGALSTSPTFGIPPTTFQLGSLPISVGNVAIGQEEFLWVKLVVPGGTPEVGNPRLALLTVKET